MCDPLTLGLMIGAGTLISAGGAVIQGQATAQTGRDRARLFTRQSARRQEEAQVEAEDFRRRERRLLSTQRAGFAASGVTTEGTPTGVGADTAKEIELAAQRIMAGGLSEATGLGITAGFERRGAGQASTAGFLRAGSTLLTGFGRGADIAGRQRIPSG